MFSVRCDTKFFKKADLLKYFDKYTDRVVACIEKIQTDDEHIHCVIETPYSMSCLRKNLRKLLIETGNKAYSLKKCNDKIKALNYTCKEKNVYYLKNYTHDDVVSFHKRFHEYKTKNVKSRNIPYYIQIFERYKDNQQLKDAVLEALKKQDYFWTTDKIFRKIIIKNYIDDNKTFPNKYQIDNISNSFFSRLLLHYGVSKKDTVNVVYSMIYEEDKPKYDIDPISIQLQNYILEK